MTAAPSPVRPADAPDQPRADMRNAPAIASEALLKGQSVVTIEHKGIRYRLQETRAGKLILTK
ncbi:hemin uptake protein HemP [Denitromonas ohlonensis]|jgi:hemin uptake protein HemP|uniref:Hemin uptake protein HemP n=2 Tax=Denitromonas TaxID=139331 RepID=A0A557RUH1_9RHOO|nr:hemin uptake protein HemP [Denitromonas ohlonensis]TVT49567.1 MAG: hemin uptake protein HemP [Denitromonas halophila]TVO68786.1 hemin uptake protein HemP [Denitromonas ohlonensis]TVO72848.1 hemin uptake protein HemP [Denitromonas ohlonensis]TVT75281.1 MAG: hemin uptake protein HemP [Denitromonas halophila]TVT76669.1 MAG: hemin uptake protein HemP [Denitromonas halophila]